MISFLTILGNIYHHIYVLLTNIVFTLSFVNYFFFLDLEKKFIVYNTRHMRVVKNNKYITVMDFMSTQGICVTGLGWIFSPIFMPFLLRR